MELETLKASIENKLVTGFIRPYKSLAKALIFFDKKLDNSLRLNMDYWGLNNTTVKNWYLLLLVGESLDHLGRAQCFT